MLGAETFALSLSRVKERATRALGCSRKLRCPEATAGLVVPDAPDAFIYKRGVCTCTCVREAGKVRDACEEILFLGRGEAAGDMEDWKYRKNSLVLGNM